MIKDGAKGNEANFGFNVIASMLDPDFDNDDNPYIKFKFK